MLTALTASDLLKLLIPVIIGFLLGILAEPFKLRVTDRFKRRKLRAACYNEVYLIYSVLKETLERCREEPDEAAPEGAVRDYFVKVASGLSVARMAYAVNDEARLMIDTDIYAVAGQLIHTIETKRSTLSTPADAVELAELVIEHIDRNVDRGVIDGHRLTLLAYEEHWDSQRRPYPRAKELRNLEIGYRNPNDLVKQGSGHPLVARLKRRIKQMRTFYRYHSK